MVSKHTKVTGRKALLAFAVSGALLVGTAAPAMADSPIATADGTDTADVKASYVKDGSQGATYSVNVTWANMDKFEFTGKTGQTWDPATHTYSGGTGDGSWSNDGGNGTVTVVNHSDVKVNVAASYQAESSYSDISGAFALNGGSGSSSTLESGVGRAPEDADQDVFTLTLSGDGSALAGVTNPAKVGTATVMISAAS